MDTQIGEKLRSWRKSKGMTLEGAAGVLDLSTSYISELETGKKELSAAVMKIYLGADPDFFKAEDFFQESA